MWSFLIGLNMKNKGGGRPALGLPRPWWEVPMHVDMGDARVGNSRTSHYGDRGFLLFKCVKGGWERKSRLWRMVFNGSRNPSVLVRRF